jgi:hypothetical protein
VDSEGDVKKFTEKVYSNIAVNDNSICDCDANEYEVAKNLKLIYEGAQKLAPTDNSEFGHDNKFLKISDTLYFPRTADDFFEDKVIHFPSKDLLVIKRPDYVGSTRWEFISIKRKLKPIKAKVLDEKWLSDWKNHEVQFWPGDALLVKLVTKRVISGKDSNIVFRDEIIEVIDIIPQERIEQVVLELSNE